MSIAIGVSWCRLTIDSTHRSIATGIAGALLLLLLLGERLVGSSRSRRARPGKLMRRSMLRMVRAVRAAVVSIVEGVASMASILLVTAKVWVEPRGRR